MHSRPFAFRLAALTALMGMTLASAACGATDGRRTTPEPEAGRLALFVPGGRHALVQDGPVNTWGTLARETVAAAKKLGMASDDVKTVTSSDLASQADAIDDYVSGHDVRGKDGAPTTLVVAPAAPVDTDTRQYGTLVSRTLPVTVPQTDDDAADGDAKAGDATNGNDADEETRPVPAVPEGRDDRSQDDEEEARDQARDAAALADALRDASRKGMTVVLAGDGIEGYVPDVAVATADAEDIGRIQAESLVDRLELEKATADSPKSVEILLPYDPDAGESAKRTAEGVFSGAWSVLSPYFRAGKAVSPSGLLTADTTDDDWHDVAFDASKADRIRAELSARLKPRGSGSSPAKVDGIIAANDHVATAVAQELDRLGYTGSATDADPSISLPGIVDSLTGRHNLTRKAVPDPARPGASGSDGTDDGDGSDDGSGDGNGSGRDGSTADGQETDGTSALRWPAVTGYGAAVSAMPGLVDGRQWMTALDDRKSLAQDIARAATVRNRGGKVASLSFVGIERVDGRRVPTVREDQLAVTAANLKTALIDPGYISMADAGL